MAKKVVKKKTIQVSQTKTDDNSFGISGVLLGVIGIIFSASPGLVMSIVGLVFSLKQKRKNPNSWSKAGIILNVISLILSIITVVLSLWLVQNQLISQGLI